MTTAVLVCGDTVAADGGGRPAGRASTVVSGLCQHPERIAEVAPDADALVLALCGNSHSTGAIQRQARRAGIDPLGVEIVDMAEAADDPARLEVVLAGAIARAERFPGSRPEHAKVTFPTVQTRRSLLSFSPLEYLAAPAIDAAMCTADRGCRACIDVCPQGALRIVGGSVVHDLAVCEPCGRCVTACPTGATANPAVTPSAVEAQMRAMLDPGVGPAGPRGIVYRCQRSRRVEDTPDWYPVTVPCTGMLPPTWLLAPLVLGAGSVAVRRCRDSGCRLAHDAITTTRVAWCRRFLTAIGSLPQRISTEIEAEPDLPAMQGAAVTDPFGAGRAAAVLLALVEATGAVDTRFDAPDSPLGLIDVDDDACTGCGTCALSCPTGALVQQSGDGERLITFDASRCVACTTCVGRCPEAANGAIRLTPTVDTSALRVGPAVAWRGTVARCESCGDVVAPVALLERIGALIGDAARPAVSRQCLACRGIRPPVE